MGAHWSHPRRHRTVRHGVDLPVIAEHRRLGDLPMRIVNISVVGFRGQGDFAAAGALGRGERIVGKRWRQATSTQGMSFAS
jgi:hypothetical protein